MKLDVFSTFNDLLLQIKAGVTLDACPGRCRSVWHNCNFLHLTASHSTCRRVPEDSIMAQLQTQVTSILKAIGQQLTQKTIKTRVAAFSTLRQLLTVLPGCLQVMASHITHLGPPE